MTSLRGMIQSAAPIRAAALGRDIYERFKAEPDTLTIPVLDDADRPIGLVERHAFFLKMAAEYGRALYARRPISTVMNTDPLVVEADTPVAEFTASSLSDRSSDLLRGFIVVENGRYLGVGTVLALLHAANEANRQGVADLAAANLVADEAQRFMSTVIESIPAMVFVKRADDHTYLLMNKAGEDILGYGREQLIGRSDADLFPPDQARLYETRDAEIVESGGQHQIEEEHVLRRDGSSTIVRTRKLAVPDAEGRPKYIVGICEDISQRKRAEAQIARLAHYDALTELPNRLLFHKDLREALARASRGGGGEVSVLCIDLDHFKTVNDTLGHPVGDALLRAAAMRLLGCARAGDTVARLGGDEFAIVQTSPTGAEAAASLAARIVAAIAEPFQALSHQVVVGASVGVAVSPADGLDPDELLKKADMALYRAKAEGRGGFHFFEQAMDEALQARRVMEVDLRGALAAGQFELHYQPLINLGSDAISCCEALLRWRHPELGMIPPADFIPLAEEIGLIVPLGAWVLREACAMAATWPAHVSLAVNISPVQFRSKGLVETVVSALSNAGLPAGRLELEITESVLLQESAVNLAALHALKALGVRISMDDFGTGYSSLSYLRSFPFDKIKIDQSFVRDLPGDTEALAIIKAVTALGASLGIRTTAEGVETQAQLDELRAQGCEEIQGYLISRPLTALAMSAMFGQNPVPRGGEAEAIHLADHAAALTAFKSSSNASTPVGVVAHEHMKRTLPSSTR